jgi:hypothetical protein
MMALAAAATAVTLGRTARWLGAPVEARRASAVRAALQLGGAAAVVAACLLVYPRAVAAFHPASGDVLFRWFGARGNQAAALAMAVLMAVVAAGVTWLVRAAIGRIEVFLLEGQERSTGIQAG